MLIASILLAAAALSGAGDAAQPPPTVTTAVRLPLGKSVRGRTIDAVEVGDPGADLRVLVVGCIHGDESAGIPVARRLERSAPQDGVDMWVLSDMNPDGVARGTRQNAHKVDLNRNFPWHWQQIGAPGDQQYSGTGPLSEPESRIARDLVRKIQPDISIWFHQPVGVIDKSGGDVRIERRFAKLVGLPLKRLARYPGGATNWQNDRFKGTTSFVAELPAGKLSQREVTRYVNAVRTLAATS
jgi:protein MpaA